MCPAGNYMQQVMIKVNSGIAEADTQSWEMPELRSPMQTTLNHLVPIHYDTALNLHVHMQIFGPWPYSTYMQFLIFKSLCLQL